VVGAGQYVVYELTVAVVHTGGQVDDVLSGGVDAQVDKEEDGVVVGGGIGLEKVQGQSVMVRVVESVTV